MSTAARNVLIVVALAAAVYFLPGGGDAAAFVGSLFTTAIMASFVLLGGRFYREHRISIHSLGDRHRLLLYVAIGAAVVALAGRPRLTQDGNSIGTFAFFVLLIGAAFAVYEVWRHYRSFEL